MFAQSLKRPRLQRPAIALIYAMYIALFLNIAYYRQVIALLPLNSVHNVLVVLSMPLVAFSVIYCVLTLAAFLWLDKLIAALFVLASATAQYFILAYGIVVDRTMVVNILDTTPAESGALITPQMLLVLLITALVPVFILCWIRITPPVRKLRALLWRLGTVVAAVAMILLVAALFYKDYASLFRNNRELVKSLSPSNSIAASLSWYRHNQMTNLPLVRFGEDARQAPLMQAGPRKNLTIVIVGETSRADNFSLAGYARQTNPRLAQDHVIFFPNTSSCGTVTAVSVPCMFSGMPRRHYDEQLASHREGLLDIVQRAGISVLWHENDGGCKGACTRVPWQDVTQLNLPGMCIKGECYDEALFNHLDAAIAGLRHDGVIVLHTIGSHGPTYNHRYPPAFRTFTPTCETNEIQGCSREQLVNTYDNTVLYVDYIVDKGIKLLQAHQDTFNTSLVYLSDHGESLGENGVYLHGLPYAIAPETQTHIPMLIWLSDAYKKQYHVSQRCLEQRAKNEAFSQDNLFSTILGITGTQTREYHATDDILAPCKGQTDESVSG